MSEEPKATQSHEQDVTVKMAVKYQVTTKRRTCSPSIVSIFAFIFVGLLFIGEKKSTAQSTNTSTCQSCLIHIDQAIEALGGDQSLSRERNFLVKETTDGRAVIEKRVKSVGSVDTLTSQSIASGRSDIPRGRKLAPADQIARKPVRQEAIWMLHPLRQLIALRSALPQDAEIRSLENPVTGQQEDALVIPESHGEALRADPRQAWFFDAKSNLPKVVIIYRSRGDSPPILDVTISFQRFSSLNGEMVPISILRKMWNGHETLVEISSSDEAAQ